MTKLRTTLKTCVLYLKARYYLGRSRGYFIQFVKTGDFSYHVKSYEESEKCRLILEELEKIRRELKG